VELVADRIGQLQELLERDAAMIFRPPEHEQGSLLCSAAAA